MTDHSHSALS